LALAATAFAAVGALASVTTAFVAVGALALAATAFAGVGDLASATTAFAAVGALASATTAFFAALGADFAEGRFFEPGLVFAIATTFSSAVILDGAVCGSVFSNSAVIRKRNTRGKRDGDGRENGKALLLEILTA
jgi:hypothetical protein